MARQLLTLPAGDRDLRRLLAITGVFIALSVFFVAYPAVDLAFSRLFYDGGFYMASKRWTKFLHTSVSWFVYGSLLAIGAAYAFNRLKRRNLWGMDGRKAVYLLLVLGLGAGLVVNEVFKDQFGRARPKDIVEFGGTAQFTPPYVVSSNCSHNCSFSCGDGAAAFFALAFAKGARRRRLVVAAAVVYGTIVSAARIVSGSHFLSDAIVSFFVMLILTEGLYYLMYRPARDSGKSTAAPPVGPETTIANSGVPLQRQ